MTRDQAIAKAADAAGKITRGTASSDSYEMESKAWLAIADHLAIHGPTDDDS